MLQAKSETDMTDLATDGASEVSTPSSVRDEKGGEEKGGDESLSKMAAAFKTIIEVRLILVQINVQLQTVSLFIPCVYTNSVLAKTQNVMVSLALL